LDNEVVVIRCLFCSDAAMNYCMIVLIIDVLVDCIGCDCEKHRPDYKLSLASIDTRVKRILPTLF